MALYIVQHGKAFSKEEDPERHITKEGIEDATRVAHELTHRDIPLDRIMHSGKSRAEDTARIFRHALDTSIPLVAHEGMAPNDDAAAFAETIDTAENLMVVGHQPFLGKLIALLVNGDETVQSESVVNAGVIALEWNNGWSVSWRIDPS